MPVDVLIAPEPEGLARGGNETILLVDDEEFIRELGVDVLGRAGSLFSLLAMGRTPWNYTNRSGLGLIW